eukprot:SAG31_NODE_3053_length_4739_cov_24.623060_2_plen_271_part_00
MVHEPGKGCYFLVFVPTIREIRDFYREMQRTNRESITIYQAQLPTATPNCGCFPPLDWNGPLAPADWPASWNDSNIYPNVKKFRHDYPGRHCIIAGGQFVDESFVCSTYWHPDPSSSSGVANITEKIEGSDGDFFVDKMQTFVHESIAESKQWLAVLMLHYIHLPHPAMPTYFEKRKDSKDPDYIGTLQQLDDTIGELVSVLKTAEVWNDTLLFYTSGNNAQRFDRSVYSSVVLLLIFSLVACLSFHAACFFFLFHSGVRQWCALQRITS